MSSTGMMEQWQLQQKALKEQERLKKLESADMLNKFRGGTVTEEELKLKAIKEEERLKKLETTEMHKQYRGGVSEGELKLSALRQEDRMKKQEAIENHHGYRLSAEDIEKRERKQRDEQYPLPVKVDHSDSRDLIKEGAVNRLKGNFDSPNGSKNHITGSPSASRKFVSEGNIEQILSPTLDDAPAHEEAAKYISSGVGSSSYSFVDSDGGNEEKKSNEAARFHSDKDFLPTEEDATYFDAGSGCGVVQPQSVMENVSTATANTAIKNCSAKEAATGSLNARDSVADEKRSSHAALSAGGNSATIRHEIGFSFGVITTAQKPEMQGYMQAVAREIKELFVQSHDALLDASYDVNCQPFVKDIACDENYSAGRDDGVHRFLITAAVPIFATCNDIVSAKKIVIQRLQVALQSGRFLLPE
ncbi:hypothetical protein MPSEU_000948800 [Mayamaea pseudoterrestris]|nr:hypothetical protein MPSEU_000948800 [Mayamaea pseudoterrestris]